MPPNDRLGLDEHEHLQPSTPQSAECNPEASVGKADPRTPTAVGERRQLLPEGEVLKREIGVRAEG
jgi:hypothetical protein